MRSADYSFFEYELLGIIGINLFRTEDYRGKMTKDYSEDVFKKFGISFIVKESMYIYSKKSVIRGLHFQETYEQPKIVQCISGNVWAVVVDINPDRKTFGKWEPVDINYGKSVYVPGDFALGTLAMEESVIACKYGEKYYAEYDTGIKWNDSTIGIEWPVRMIGNPIVSQKDEKLQSFQEYVLKQKGRICSSI